jgi:hypothetical protein
MGLLKQSREQGGGLSRIERDVTVSAFARRRLGVIMVRNGMVETVKAVSAYIYIYIYTGPFPAFIYFSYSTIPGRHFYRTGSRSGRHRRCNRPGFPSDTKHGRLCDMGGFQQDQAHHHEIPG